MAAEDAKTVFRQPKQQALFVSALFRRNSTRSETLGSPSKSGPFTRNSTRNSSPLLFRVFRVSLLLERPNRNRGRNRVPRTDARASHTWGQRARIFLTRQLALLASGADRPND
jgi:hypothetical protein